MTREQQKDFINMIRRRYRYQLMLDHLPSATETYTSDGDKDGEEHLIDDYEEGIQVGEFLEDGSVILYNHLAITVKTHHVTNGDELRIVGFEVLPMSIDFESPLDPETIQEQPMQYLLRSGAPNYEDISHGILFSYSFTTVNDESTTWATRMDHYYAIGKYDVHMR